MENRIKVKDTFKAEKVCKEFYTGGVLKITNDGQTFLCMCTNHITIVNVEDSLIKQTIPPNFVEYNYCDGDETIEDPVVTFALSKDEELIASSHKSGLIKLWKWKTAELLKSWKGQHKGPSMKLSFNATSTYLASGSMDNTIRVWDIENHSCNFKLSGVEGVTSILEFHMIGDEEILFASGDEHAIRGWRLKPEGNPDLKYKLVGQYNKISNILVTPNHQYLISVGFNPLAIVWDLETKKELRSIPISLNGPVSGATLLPACLELPGFEKPITGNFVAFGAENGKLIVYDFLKGAAVYTHNGESELMPNESENVVKNASYEKSHSIVCLNYNKSTENLIQVFSDQTILFYKLDSNFSCHKQMTGYLDEILDLTYFGEVDEFLIVASNSSNLSVYDENMNCSLLKGHSDCIISLATSPAFPNLFVSGSKDHSVRVWMCKDNIFKCVAVGTRHQASVGAVVLSHNSQDGKIVSASEDQTLKIWKLPLLKYKQCATLEVWRTVIAHDQAINSICISVRGDLIATGSQDKTAKLWSAKDLALVGVLRGHIRAIWCVKFSPVDQVILTSSADMTLRLWCINELRCLKTIEGHECSVLNCAFFNNGTQIVSCGNDGLVKVWAIKNNECVSTLDKHASKVWSVAVSSDENRFVTGGTDSRLVFWRDATEESRIEEIKTTQERVEQEQRLENLLQSNQLLDALQYAITLNRPFKVFKIIDSLSGKQTEQLENVIGQLNVDQKETIIKFASEWNKNSRSSYIAQMVLSFLMPEIISNELKLSNETLEGLLAYTNRHFSRLTTLLEDVQLVTYTVKLMEPHAG